jgi:hypothetical protein
VQQHYGGFVGVMRGSLSNCYTTAPLYITLTGSGAASNASFIGGFIADFNTSTAGNSNWTIENCYAAGDVTVQNMWSGYTKALRAGGFIGSMGGWGTTDYSTDTLPDTSRNVHIKNCYALGNVTVTSDGSGEISAGGFAGIVVIPSANLLEHCFAAGAVLAGATSSSPGNVYAGGLVGRWRQGTIKNCAARGPSVAAMGKTNGNSSTGDNVGRVYGYSAGSSASYNISNNYALRDMTLESADSISTAPAPRPAISGTSGQDGGDVAASLLRSAYFWTTNITFESLFWDFSGVNRGYPALVGLGGQ